MEARTKTIEDWFAMIRESQITLPRFQRFEAWRYSQIEGVFENILRVPSLPIGALLVLEVGDKEIFVSRPVSGAPDSNNRPQMNLLDGQQRITALWRSLNDDYKDMTVFVSLDDTDRPDVETCRRYLSKSGATLPAWANDPALTFKKNKFPIGLLCPGSAGEARLQEWLRDAGVDPDTTFRIMKLRQRIASYQIPFLSLPPSTEQETALDVFINMNTSASPLKDFDIVVAQLEGAIGESLHEKIDDLRISVPAVDDFGKVEDIALAVGALLNDKPPLKKTYLDPGFGKLLANVWDDVVLCLERGISQLKDECIFNEKLLPSEVIVYLTSALWAHVPVDGVDTEGRARTLIRQTIWRASFTDRYSKTATTRAYADYKAISAMITTPDTADTSILFDENQHPLPNVDELTRGGWPGRKDRLGRAIMAASLTGGGYDFGDGAKAKSENVRSREYHHVYPRSLIASDVPEGRVNSALNCALISWKTNRKIAAKTPKAYLEERAQDANATEAQVRDRLKSHLVPYDALISGDFDLFLSTRAEDIGKRMKELCAGSVI